jgi:hypothetical protein
MNISIFVLRYEFFCSGNYIGAIDVWECMKCVIRNYTDTCHSNLRLTVRIDVPKTLFILCIQSLGNAVIVRQLLWHICVAGDVPLTSRIVLGSGHLTVWWLARWFAEPISSTLKIEAMCSSETSVEIQRTTRRHIPEDDTLKNYIFRQMLCKCKTFLLEKYSLYLEPPSYLQINYRSSQK